MRQGNPKESRKESAHQRVAPRHITDKGTAFFYIENGTSITIDEEQHKGTNDGVWIIDHMSCSHNSQTIESS